MKRVAVSGCCGAGKSTFCRSLQAFLKLPVVHLDKIYWSENWTPAVSEVFQEEVAAVHERDEWIIDGNYASTMKARLDRADAVVFLDLSTLVCMTRVLHRIISGHGMTRPDVAEGCPERFDMEFLMYVLSFRRKQRPGLLKILNEYPDLRIHRATNSREAEQVLETIRGEALVTAQGN